MSQMKTKHIFTSILIHAGLLCIFILNLNGQPIETTPETIENSTTDIEIIEVSQGHNDSVPFNPDKFYWGIGIESTEVTENNAQFGMIPVVYVNSVKHGYSAEEAGLLKDDKIFLVDGRPMFGENDIKGDEPKEIRLTIIRNGIILNITLPRVKVYY